MYCRRCGTLNDDNAFKCVQCGDELQQKLSWVKGNQFAKGALDLAWWDLYAKSRNQPLWRVIGGIRETVSVGADFGIMDSMDELIQTIGVALKAGYQRVKLKYRPDWEIEVVQAVRERFPDITLHVDCNSAYTINDLNMFKQLDQYELAMIEQPLANIPLESP